MSIYLSSDNFQSISDLQRALTSLSVMKFHKKKSNMYFMYILFLTKAELLCLHTVRGKTLQADHISGSHFFFFFGIISSRKTAQYSELTNSQDKGKQTLILFIMWIFFAGYYTMWLFIELPWCDNIQGVVLVNKNYSFIHVKEPNKRTDRQ